jgi:hypothetical protein
MFMLPSFIHMVTGNQIALPEPGLVTPLGQDARFDTAAGVSFHRKLLRECMQSAA